MDSDPAGQVADAEKLGAMGSQPVADGAATDAPVADNGSGSATADAPPRNPQPSQPAGPPKFISFDDLNLGMQPDVPFHPRMLGFNGGRAKQLEGQPVIIGGYMLATDSMTGVKDFILLRNLECKFGPGGQADHLVHVLMQGDASTDFTDKVVYVEGKLTINPYPEPPKPAWSVYDIQGVKVSRRPPPRDQR